MRALQRAKARALPSISLAWLLLLAQLCVFSVVVQTRAGELVQQIRSRNQIENAAVPPAKRGLIAA